VVQYGVVAACVALTLAVPQASAGHDNDDPEYRHRGDASVPRGLQGVWQVKLTPKDCTTGVPAPVSFPALFTFHADGTVSADIQNYVPSQTIRSTNHGLWRANPRFNNYSFRFVHLRFDLQTHAYLGTQVGVSTAVLGRHGDTFTTDGSTIGLDPQGNEQYSGCATLAGVRLKLE
jgi:hypothetical protein